MNRSYIRLPIDFGDEHTDLTDGAFRTYVALLCLAARQTPPGRFHNRDVMRAYLPSRLRRYLPELERTRRLHAATGGTLYLDGWDELQEGDWKVAERMARYRNRKRVTDANVPAVTFGDVTAVSDRGKGQEQETDRQNGAHGAPARQSMNLSNLYRALSELTGAAYTENGKYADWIDDLCREFDRGEVGRAMYGVTNPRSPDHLLSRVTRHLRHGREL